jgi:hypothetical protein
MHRKEINAMYFIFICDPIYMLQKIKPWSSYDHPGHLRMFAVACHRDKVHSGRKPGRYAPLQAVPACASISIGNLCSKTSVRRKGVNAHAAVFRRPEPDNGYSG